MKEITKFVFSARCEESRFGALRLLSGVRFTTASVILHFRVDQSYPILDSRASWSLGIKPPFPYTFAFWNDYVRLCRTLAVKYDLSVWELNMALWQYASEHQRR